MARTCAACALDPVLQTLMETTPRPAQRFLGLVLAFVFVIAACSGPSLPDAGGDGGPGVWNESTWNDATWQ